MKLPMTIALKMVPMEMRLPGGMFQRERAGSYCTSCLNTRQLVMMAAAGKVRAQRSNKGTARAGHRDAVEADTFFESVVLVEGVGSKKPTHASKARALSVLLEMELAGVAPQLNRNEVLACIWRAKEKKRRLETTCSVLSELQRARVPIEMTDFDTVHLLEGYG